MEQKNNSLIVQFIDGLDFETIELVYSNRVILSSKKTQSRWNLEKHSHNVIEMIYYIDGRARLDFAEDSLQLSSYNMVLYPPGLIHEEHPDIRFKQDIIVVCVDIKSRNALNSAIQIADKGGDLRWLFEQINNEYNRKEYDCNQVVAVYLKAIFLLIRRYSTWNKPEYDEVFRSCIAYIHDHFCEEITIETLSSFLHLSSSASTRLFNKNIGITPMRYLSLVRIEEAKKLICSTAFSIKTIAEKIGFQDPLYFSRLFSKELGISPEKFRKQWTSR